MRRAIDGSSLTRANFLIWHFRCSSCVHQSNFRSLIKVKSNNEKISTMSYKANLSFCICSKMKFKLINPFVTQNCLILPRDHQFQPQWGSPVLFSFLVRSSKYRLIPATNTHREWAYFNGFTLPPKKGASHPVTTRATSRGGDNRGVRKGARLCKIRYEKCETETPLPSAPLSSLPLRKIPPRW